MDATKIGRRAVMALALACALPLPALADDASLGQQIVDVMNKLWGSHAGFRANHAKGLLTEGSFTPTSAGAGLSTSPLFVGKATPVTVRFSDATGIPTLADGLPDANPHGMSVKFHLADGSEMDIVANSLKFFPVATGEDFRELLQAVVDSPPDAPKPTPLETFVGSHPAVPKAFAGPSTPSSFAREVYNGLNAFVFVDSGGKRQPFRFRLTPDDGTTYLSASDAAQQKPDFLFDELRARLGRQPVQFHLLAQIAAAGDPTNDATRPWPDDRQLVDLGTIVLNKVVDDSASAEKQLLFTPTNLTDGIEASDDPLIDTRADAYAVSFSRRSE